MVKPKTFHLVSLGCAKNTIDSDSMAQLLTREGYAIEKDAQKAEVLIVNTCGFIEPARRESFSTLANLCAKKPMGQLLVAAGCLTQRYGTRVTQGIPGIDGILGTRRWMDIVQVVQQLNRTQPAQLIYHLPETPTVGRDEAGVLRASRHGVSAYLKIADGCRRPCAFCAIPLIKGNAVSRPLNDIVQDACSLQDSGVKEIVLIAQDTTDYGYDLGMKDGLATLLQKLVLAAPRIEWLRIMYAYPGYVTDNLIEVMERHTQVLPYLDIPLQHAHPDTLRRMKRPANIDWVYRTLEKMRSAMPELALRTTFIVGYPGENETEFSTLLEFVRAIRFDRVGVFPFSFEEGTASEPLGDPVPNEVKQDRLDRLMSLQQEISLEINRSLIGKTLDVLIEGQGELLDEDGKETAKGPISIGRTYRDAPEIDGLVFVEGKVPNGSLIPVRIHSAMPYDLGGIAVKR